MSISRALMDGLGGRAPFAGSVQRLEAAEPGVAAVRCDVIAADHCGCALVELECRSPVQRVAANDLASFADGICKRVNYLMEPLRLVEFDANAGALVMSASPRRKGDAVGYYQFHTSPNGVTTLHRIEYQRGTRRKVNASFALTLDQLEQLVEDLVDLQRIRD